MKMKTTQKNIVIPTGELIKNKEIDYRVLCALSLISNVDDNTIEGDNIRYCKSSRINNNIDNISRATNIRRRQTIEKMIKIINHNKDCLFRRDNMENGEYELEIHYKKGCFVTIPKKIVEDKLLKLTDTQLKIFITIWWNYTINNKKEVAITNEYILKSIGLSENSKTLVTKNCKILEEKNLIQTRIETISPNPTLFFRGKGQYRKLYKIKGQ